ncbi:MAG: tRNA uracil 4-sulfurtransferase ThiI [Candidatus Bathyarchaeia archaeon]
MEVKKIIEKLAKVFGISSLSSAIQTTCNIEDIKKVCVEVARQKFKPEQSFAVRCRRVGLHTYSSMDVCREVGRQILNELFPLKLHVDLKNPQTEINIEIREDSAFIFTETVKGVGGFPLGSQKKLVGLLSGGIDSSVACWFVMKRGCPLVPIYFDNAPFTDETTLNKAVEVAKKLGDWSIGFEQKMYIVPHGGNLDKIITRAPRNLTCILCKRTMYRIAERIAEMEDAEGIVTGEAIGEQASQTIHNLRVLNMAVARYPVHRPLLGFDKNETEQLARKIGTYEASIGKATACSAVPQKPTTQAKIEEVEEAESVLDIDRMVEESTANLKIINL